MKKTCEVCAEPARVKGLCDRHYMQQRRGVLGEPLLPYPAKKSERRTKKLQVALSPADLKRVEDFSANRGHRTVSALVRELLIEKKILSGEHER